MKNKEKSGLSLYASYEAFYDQELNHINPSVSYCEENDKVYVRPTCTITAVYDVTADTLNQELYLHNVERDKVVKMNLDGKNIDYTTTYTFTSMGRHILRMTLQNSDDDSFNFADNERDLGYHNLVELSFDDSMLDTQRMVFHDGLYLMFNISTLIKLDLWNCKCKPFERTHWICYNCNNLQTLILPKDGLNGCDGIYNIPITCIIYCYPHGDFDYQTALKGYNVILLDKEGNINI